MRVRLIVGLLFALLGSACQALESADPPHLQECVETLSSSRFGGRMLGSSEAIMARRWIAQEAESAGLLPAEDPQNPLQPFRVLGRRWESIEASLVDQAGRSHSLIMKSESRPFEEFGSILPWPSDEAPPPCALGEILARDFDPARGDSPVELLDLASAAGAGALLLLPPSEDEHGLFARYRQRAASSEQSAYCLPGDPFQPLLLYGSDSLKIDLLAGKNDWHLRLPDYESFSLEGGNLLYRVPRARDGDPIVLLVAHYDHLGREGDAFYPGANDNASGVAVLLELAALLEQRRYPFQLRFLFSDGEEEGWLGARYCLEHSDRPALMINLDTVGRAGVEHYRFLGDPSAAREELLMLWTDRSRPSSALLGEMAEDAGFELRRGEGPIFERAGDHFPYARAGMPAMFLFGGFHADYHQKGDTADKVLPGKLANLTELLRDYLDALAEDPSLIGSSTR